jgi:GMP synthase-like glutamine amidotransferase
MRALVIGNAGDFDTGFVGRRLREHGFRFVEGHREHRADWPTLDGLDLVLTLGSEWNVYRPETAATVEAEAALVRDVVGRGVPFLGICFGGQVLAHALGGTVSRSPVAEIGWFELAVDAAGIASGPWMEWHDDVFTPPEGFDVLARTAVGPQLIRGGRCLGTQFHPEATETIVRDWVESGGAAAYRAHGGDPDALLEETHVNVGRSGPAAGALVDWFLEHVAGAV